MAARRKKIQKKEYREKEVSELDLEDISYLSEYDIYVRSKSFETPEEYLLEVIKRLASEVIKLREGINERLHAVEFPRNTEG